MTATPDLTVQPPLTVDEAAERYRLVKDQAVRRYAAATEELDLAWAESIAANRELDQAHHALAEAALVSPRTAP